MKELRKYFQFDEREDKIFIPNEIFEDFKKLDKNHVAYAFSYYYINNWMYRYAKYGFVTNCPTQKELRGILGYNPENKRLNYLTKKNGVLEQMEYLETTREIPVVWEMGHSFKWNISEELEFTYYEYNAEMDKYGVNFPPSYTIKKPIRAFTRHVNDEEAQEDYKNDYVDGTFYEIDNTTLIPFEVFLFCMERKELSSTAFYIWSYFKWKNQIFEEGYKGSISELAEEFRMDRKTVIKYLKLLRKHSMIEVEYGQDTFIVGLPEEERESNTYITNEPEEFNEFGDDEIKKLKIELHENYIKEREKKKGKKIYKKKKKNPDKVFVPLEKLPY